MTAPLRPHFAFPFTHTATGSQTVEQGSTEHIMAQVQVVTYCPLGYRDDRPEFGWPWPDMKLQPIDPTPLMSAIKTLVPRVVQLSSPPDPNALINAAMGVTNMEIDIQTPGGDSTGVSQGVD